MNVWLLAALLLALLTVTLAVCYLLAVGEDDRRGGVIDFTGHRWRDEDAA